MEVKLRQLCNDIRRKPIPLADVIPTMQAAATEIERLRAEVEALKLQRAAAGLVHRETATTVLMQAAEAEALRADAERWEHARSIACFTEDRDMGPGGWWTVAVHVKRRPAANTIDAAVDAARAAQGGEHG